MFFLKSLLSFFILPPINLVLVILLGLLVLRGRPRLGRWLIGASAVLLLLLAVPVVGGSMLTTLEQNLPTVPPADHPPGAIVILSAELHWTGGSDPGVEVGRLTLERLRAGAELYHKTHLPILVSGGLLGDGGPPVADVMAETLQRDFGVPVRWVEAQSRDTWQNATLSAAMLRPAGIDSVYVVTHAWHEHRAILAFRRAGLIATAAPTAPDRFPKPVGEDFVPAVSIWVSSFYALHEWIGYVWYSLP